MAQFQGVKIYEAPRCRLSYFALWHQTTKIDAMFKILEPHVKQEDSSEPYKQTAFKHLWSMKSKVLLKAVFIVSQKWF